MLGGEETSVIRAMLAEGAEGWWVPGAKVRHFIPRERQSRWYLRRFFFGQGKFFANKNPDSKAVMLLGRPRWWWRQAIEAEVRYRYRRMVCKPGVWIEDLIRSSYWWGQLRGYQFRRGA